MARVLGYRACLDWLLNNDCCEWLDDEYGSISVSASLVADIFDKTDEHLTHDLRMKKRARDEKEKA